MTHLGTWVTPLVDGQLPADVAERALVHTASCAACRATVAAERGVRRRLSEAPDPAPSPDLVARLLALGGPDGPLAPRPGHVPGSPRPAAVGLSGASVGLRRPAGRSDAVRPVGRAGRRSRIATVAVGAFSLASVSLLGLLLLGGTVRQQPDAPSVALGAAAVLPGGLPGAQGGGTSTRGAVAGDSLDRAELADLREQGWPCPDALPEGLRLVDARRVTVDGAPLVHLRYSDGTSTVSVLEHEGRLAPAQAAAFSEALTAGARVDGGGEVPWHGVWQSGDVVVAVVADADSEVISGVVEALPPSEPADSWWERLGHGTGMVAALLGDH